MTQKSLEKSTFYDLWAALTDNQRAYVMAALRLPTKKEAAESIGLKPNTVYSWGKSVDDAIEALRFDMTTAAADIMSAALAEAVVTQVNLLRCDDPRVQLSASKEIIDRLWGQSVVKGETESRYTITFDPDDIPNLTDEELLFIAGQSPALSEAGGFDAD